MLSLHMIHCLLNVFYFWWFKEKNWNIETIILCFHGITTPLSIKMVSHHKTMRDDVIDYEFIFYLLLHALFMAKLCDKNLQILIQNQRTEFNLYNLCLL